MMSLCFISLQQTVLAHQAERVETLLVQRIRVKIALNVVKASKLVQMKLVT